MNATVTWDEDRKTGAGMLTARDETGRTIATEPWDEPISASTDSDAVAQAILGHLSIVSVEHDGEFVHVTIAE